MKISVQEADPETTSELHFIVSLVASSIHPLSSTS